MRSIKIHQNIEIFKFLKIVKIDTSNMIITHFDIKDDGIVRRCRPTSDSRYRNSRSRFEIINCNVEGSR